MNLSSDADYGAIIDFKTWRFRTIEDDALFIQTFGAEGSKFLCTKKNTHRDTRFKKIQRDVFITPQTTLAQVLPLRYHTHRVPFDMAEADL